jgi:hypothetical protein
MFILFYRTFSREAWLTSILNFIVHQEMVSFPEIGYLGRHDLRRKTRFYALKADESVKHYLPSFASMTKMFLKTSLSEAFQLVSY